MATQIAGNVPDDDEAPFLAGMVDKIPTLLGLLVGTVVLFRLFLFFGGHHWMTLALLPVPAGNIIDDIAGPPHGPVWGRVVYTSIPADDVLHFYETTLPRNSWTIAWQADTSAHCIKGEHPIFSTMYIWVVDRSHEGGAAVNISPSPQVALCEI